MVLDFIIILTIIHILFVAVIVVVCSDLGFCLLISTLVYVDVCRGVLVYICFGFVLLLTVFVWVHCLASTSASTLTLTFAFAFALTPEQISSQPPNIHILPLDELQPQIDFAQLRFVEITAFA